MTRLFPSPTEPVIPVQFANELLLSPPLSLPTPLCPRCSLLVPSRRRAQSRSSVVPPLPKFPFDRFRPPAIPLSKQRRQNAHRAVGCPCIQQASERPGFHPHRVVKRWREGGREALYLSAIYSRGGSDRGWKSDRGRVGLYKEMAVDIVNSRGREREEWRGDPPCLSLIRRELKVQCLPLSNANWSTCAC